MSDKLYEALWNYVRDNSEKIVKSEYPLRKALQMFLADNPEIKVPCDTAAEVRIVYQCIKDALKDIQEKESTD